jgi:plasmid stabilization system protein ParE
MNLPVRALALATEELTEAVRWYESRRSGLGAELLDDVDEAILRLAANPSAGHLLSTDRHTRRILLVRFPYQLVFRVRTTEIVVVAVAHLKRRPGYWKSRA